MIRYSVATWKGSGMTGIGEVTTDSGALDGALFGFDARFSETAPGLSPEELLSAAHATDFSMKLSFVLTEAGYVVKSLSTTAAISFVNGMIAGSHLKIAARVPGITQVVFDNCLAEADRCCPLTRALRIDVTYGATLEDGDELPA